MKKYYLHNGTESSGPFDIEELKAKKITKTTPVWFEEMENWKYAGEIPQLNTLFIITPPPISPFYTPQPASKEERREEMLQILGLSKSSFFIIGVALVLATSTVIFNNIIENKEQELRVRNHKTEVENYQLELQQKEIEEQKIIQAEAEKAAAERAIQEKKQSDTDRLIEIEKTIAISQSNLEASQKKLNNTSGFKLLRTASEKKAQIDVLYKSIDSIKNEIDQLKIESNQLKLKLEKTL
jgi:hypothetical protein